MASVLYDFLALTVPTSSSLLVILREKKRRRRSKKNSSQLLVTFVVTGIFFLASLSALISREISKQLHRV